MRIAIVDLLFCWPPHGGADVDCFHVAEELHRLGHEVHLFGVNDPDSWERGVFDAATLPFAVTRVVVRRGELGHAPERLREAVAAWGPEVVLLGDGFFLKPLVMAALHEFPVVSRYYAYEAFCHRDILHFKGGAPCPLNYFDTPDVCRHCALEGLGPSIQRGLRNAWLDEYRAARAFEAGYSTMTNHALRGAAGFIVYNEIMAAPLRRFPGEVAIVPGGVDLDAFGGERRPPPGRQIVLMAGRAEDPAKGAQVLLAAGERLAQDRDDFVIWATLPLDTPRTPWFEPIGWQLHADMQGIYRQASIAVVPSVWDEPFGMVALEAMASGCAVCLSRVGGLQHIVEDGKSGLLFDRGDAEDLARQLARLLGDAGLREAIGNAGRARVEQEYTWPHIVRTYYEPLLRRVVERSGGRQATNIPPPPLQRGTKAAKPQTERRSITSTRIDDLTESDSIPPLKGGRGDVDAVACPLPVPPTKCDHAMRVCALYSRGPHYVRVLKALRQGYPDVHLAAVVPPGFPEAVLVKLADEVMFLAEPRYSLRDPWRLLRLLQDLRAARYDVFVTMFDSTRLRLLARASGARECFCQTLDGRYVSLRGSLTGQALRAVARNVAGWISYWRIRGAVRGTSVRK